MLYMTAKKGFLTSDALTTDDVPDVAAELSEGLGRIKLKQEMVESYKNKKDVFVNDLPYTQQSISPRFGFRASLQVLVSSIAVHGFKSLLLLGSYEVTTWTQSYMRELCYILARQSVEVGWNGQRWKPSLQDARSVCQSTAEVLAPQSDYLYASLRGVNPRRLP